MSKDSRHEITKGLPKEVRELADSAIDHLGRIVDNTSSRDVIYIATFVMGTWYVYNKIKLTKGAVKEMIENPWMLLASMAGFGMGWVYGTTMGVVEKVEAEAETAEVDPETVAEAMLITYGLMRIDVGDVASAITKITAAISTA